MTSISRRIKIYAESFSGRKKKRETNRVLRQTAIRENKKGVAIDLAAGHNVGDFTLDKLHLRIIMSTIRGDRGITMTQLKLLYEKYRGK